MLAPAPRRYPADVPAPSDRDPDALRRFALGLVDETDPIALAFAGGELIITAKHDRTLVTPADTGIEEILRDRMAAAFPRHGVLGEELGTEPGDGGKTRWIIKTIDGTHNFVRGIPVWATLHRGRARRRAPSRRLSAPRRCTNAGTRHSAWAPPRAGSRRRAGDPRFRDARAGRGAALVLDVRAPGSR